MLRALARAGYDAPTPIQIRAIPPALRGQNVIGCAATGTGKTAAFMLPLLERAAGKKGTRALVLSPTRELAEQTHAYVDTFGPAHKLRSALIVGGLGMGPQVAALRQRRAVVVATPGRLIDHLDQGTADLSQVETLVLDEADRMLDMGFRPQLERILRQVQQRKQTLLFSATMAGEVQTFAAQHVPDAERIEVHRSGTTAQRAEQRLYQVERHEKIAMLLTLLWEDDERTLVFVRTKHRADKIARVLERSGHRAARIHGGRSQGQRKQALAGFKDGRYRVLVATDVAARGIDVEDVGHVINLDLPSQPEDYVHRIGRTARNAASGVASSLAEPADRQALRDIERLIGKALPRERVPRENPIFVEEAERRKKAAPQPRPGADAAQAPAAPRPRRAVSPVGESEAPRQRRAESSRSDERPARRRPGANAAPGRKAPRRRHGRSASKGRQLGGAPR